MGKYYQLSFKGINYWTKEENDIGNEIYKRVKKSGTIFLEKTDRPFLNDFMLCNYRNAEYKKQGIRIIEHNDELIIEPSGIRIPKTNMKELPDDTKFEEKYTRTIPNLSSETFICNCMSSFTRGGLEEIYAYDFNKYKEELLSANYDKTASTAFLSPFDFIRLFCIYKADSNDYTFCKWDLEDFTLAAKSDINYGVMLHNVDVYQHEHDNVSPDMDKSLLLLRYFGAIHPDYDKDNMYGFLIVDSDYIGLYALENDLNDNSPMKSFVEEFNEEYSAGYEHHLN